MTEPGQILRIDAEDVDGTTVLHVAGEIDVATADDLVDAVAGSDGPLVVELAGVTFMDSTGVRALVVAQGIADERGRPFSICCPSATVARLLELIDMRGRIPEVTRIGLGSVDAVD